MLRMRELLKTQGRSKRAAMGVCECFFFFFLSLKCGLFEIFGVELGKPCGTLS